MTATMWRGITVVGATVLVLVGSGGDARADITGSVKLRAGGRHVGQGSIARGKEVAQNVYGYTGWLSTPNGKMHLFGAKVGNKFPYACFGWAAKGNTTSRVSVFTIVAKSHLYLERYASGVAMRFDGYGPRRRGFVGSHAFGLASTETRMSGGRETLTNYTIKKLSPGRYAITGAGQTAIGVQVGPKLLCAASGTGTDRGVAAIKFGARGPTEMMMATTGDKQVIRLHMSR